MNKRQINRFLRHQFSPICWSLTAYYFIMNIMVSVTMIYELAKGALLSLNNDTVSAVDQQALLGNAWGYIITCMIFLVVLISWKGPVFWKRDIWHRGQPMSAGLFFLTLFVFLGFQLYSSFLTTILNLFFGRFGIDIMEQYEEMALSGSDSFSMFLYASLFAPVVEEILFRGLVLQSLRPYGRNFAIWGSAFLFGMFHGNLVQTPFAFLIGLILGFITVEYSIGWSMLLHMINNLVLADLLPRITSFLPSGVGDMISGLIIWSSAVVGIVVMAVYRKKIAAYIHGDRTDRQCVRCFFLNSGMIVFLIVFLGNMVLTLMI